MKLPLIFVAAFAVTGCAGALSGPAHDVTTSTVSTLDDPLTKKQLLDLAASTVGVARDVALDDKTVARLKFLVTVLMEKLRDELALTRAEVRILVRQAIAEALGPQAVGEVAVLRETLVGPALRADLSAALSGALDDAGPHLSAALATAVETSAARVRADTATSAKADVEKWKWIAVAFGGLVLALIVLHAHALATERSSSSALVVARTCVSSATVRPNRSSTPVCQNDASAVVHAASALAAGVACPDRRWSACFTSKRMTWATFSP